MSFIFKKYFLIVPFLSVLLINCGNKSKINDNIVMVLDDFYPQKDSVLHLKVINNSNENYYITLDTNRTYDYGAFNSKRNNSVILKTLVYSNGELQSLKGERYVSKRTGAGKSTCIGQEIEKSDHFYKNYISLKNAVFLKSKSSTVLALPFSLSYKTCFTSNHYDLKKEQKNELKVQYSMLKEILEKDVSAKTRDSLEKKGYKPYYQVMVSNKAAIFL